MPLSPKVPAVLSPKLSMLPAALAIGALVAGCGSAAGGSSGSSGASAQQAAGGGYGSAVAAAAPATAQSARTRLMITTAHSKSLGTILVDGHRHTLYVFHKDRPGSGRSTCMGACAAEWPPVTAKAMPSTAGGVQRASLSLFRRTDGSRQLAFHGRPLYWFSGDSAGTTNGQGLNDFGGLWTAVTPSGRPA